jgi:hypothetical protein
VALRASANDRASVMGGQVWQVLPWAVKGEGMSVTEAVYTGTEGLDGRRRWLKVDMVAMRWCCSAPKGNEVSSCVGGVSTAVKQLCGFWP